MVDSTEKVNDQNGYYPKKILADFFLLIICFILAFLIKKRALYVDPEYIRLFGIVFISWIISSFLTNKLKYNEEERRFYKRIEPIFTSALIFIGLITFFISGLGWISFSRMIIFGFFGLFVFLEVVFLSGNYFPFFRGIQEKRMSNFSYLLFSLDLLVIGVGFFALNYFKSGSIIIQEPYQPILFLLMFLWFICGLLIHRFQIYQGENYLKLIYPYIKSTFIVISIVSVIIFVLRTGFSRIMVFGSLALVSLLELIFVTINFLYKRIKKSDFIKISLFDAPIISQGGVVETAVERQRNKQEKVCFEKKGFKSTFFKEKLKNIYLNNLPDLYNQIDKTVDLSTVDILKAEFINKDIEPYINNFKDQSLEIMVNLFPLNNFGMINQYLSNVNHKLIDQGIYVGVFEPCERRKFYFIRKYPPFLANFLYMLDFFWKRVFPKTLFLKKIYFALTQGKKRVISFAEGLGRLYYNGFEILSLEDFDNYIYFVVKKVSPVSNQQNPSYGFLFKQKRVGKNKKFVYIYKMRTMHPYSEFIHKYIYLKNKLDEKGKIADDFRITSWGRFMRKFWLDEIPMLINFIKGELSLIGVRPLSETFYETYPEDLREERIKIKPGLIPPYYADMPNSIQEVYESERRYLKAYFKHPIKTKWKYLTGALKNIIIYRAKSR